MPLLLAVCGAAAVAVALIAKQSPQASMLIADSMRVENGYVVAVLCGVVVVLIGATLAVRRKLQAAKRPE